MALAPVFDETYEDYLSQIAGIDLEACRTVLGIGSKEDQAIIPFFNAEYLVGARGVFDPQGKRPPLSVCIVMFKYLLMCPKAVQAKGGLVTYKDFKDAAPLIHFFRNTIEGEVARQFGKKASSLEKACRKLCATAYAGDLSYQVKYQFQALPRIPVYLLFNDAEEGFPAQCTLLFDHSTEAYLDMESVAMLSGSLVHMLKSSIKT